MKSGTLPSPRETDPYVVGKLAGFMGSATWVLITMHYESAIHKSTREILATHLNAFCAGTVNLCCKYLSFVSKIG